MGRGPALSPRTLPALLLITVLSACGGGGGGGSSSAPPASPPPSGNDNPTPAELQAASRFAGFATFGLNYQAIDSLARQGRDNWLNQQFALPATRHLPVVDDLIGQLQRGELPEADNDVDWLIQFRRFAWWHNTMTAQDQLRQRVAYALSQLMVVSDNVDTLIVYPAALSSYNDVLLTHAFGNFRDLLYDVAMHPAMGFYLSHLNNARADPTSNTFPDENFAREVMQLFSIGLYELNEDGSRRLDADGAPIPTYDNNDIREFSKVFTGLTWGGENAFFGNQEPNFRAPMEMFDEFHEPGEKRLLRGEVIPAGQTGLEDIDAAIDNLFNHPNVGPFVSKQLIQRLVTSNPSPEYVGRVAAAFNGAGGGERGDMREVVRAILTDPDIDTQAGQPAFGKLREPVLRATALYRQFNATSSDGFFANNGFGLQFFVRQHPLSAPSVFNFYLPDHQPAGLLADEGLVAPEFQITTASTVVGMTNAVDAALAGFVMSSEPQLGEVTLDFSDYVALADEGVEPLIDRLGLVATYGTLSDDMRSVMTDVLTDIQDDEFRAQMAIYMILTSPDYAVQN